MVEIPDLAFLFAALALGGALQAQDDVRVLDPGLHHLGDSNVPTWTEVTAEPEGTKLDLMFEASVNAGEHTLELRYRDVDDPWYVRLNGDEIAVLRNTKVYRTEWYAVPPRTLHDGRNLLTIAPSKTTDDIIVGEIRLHRRSLREILRLQAVQIVVEDTDGAPLPARVTIATREGKPVLLYYAEAETTAVREGICYTSNGALRVEIPPGEYDVFATRGNEWGLGRASLEVGDQPPPPVRLRLAREVDTAGWIACDTHIHTLTYSGHGNASIEERMVTLAAEGVELAIATDHNHNTDYRPVQARMRLSEHFTPVTGNEVTTDNGHFNSFPLDPRDSVPEHKIADWVKLIDGIRAKGAKVVILNHPRWPKINDSPFAEFALDRLSGDRGSGPAFTFDAMELVNATTEARDPLFLFRDWFALLNRGERIAAVGSSDSHTVDDPVGQGRTYLRSSTDDPARIDVDEACRAFLTGDCSVSLGVFCTANLGEVPMGGTASIADRRATVTLRAAAPAWIRPRRALVFVNGQQVAEQAIDSRADAPTDVTLELQVTTPAHDGYLVCVVLGDAVAGPYWPELNRYTLGATNPIRLDVDGDGIWRSPRETAQRLLDEHGAAPAALGPALAACDDAVAIQGLALVRAAGDTEALAQLAAGPWSRPLWREYHEQQQQPPRKKR